MPTPILKAIAIVFYIISQKIDLKGRLKMSVINLTKENFENEVMKSDKTVLIDFSAAWCGPCRMIAPIVDEIAEENASVKVCKIDVDSEPELASAFSVSSIPMLVVIKNGKVISHAVGLRPKDAIISMLKD